MNIYKFLKRLIIVGFSVVFLNANSVEASEYKIESSPILFMSMSNLIIATSTTINGILFGSDKETCGNRVGMSMLPFASPLNHYRVSSNYGYRRDPFNNRKAFHNGIDLMAPLGSAVYSTAPGVVKVAGWRGNYGKMVEIDHGNGIKTRYGHLHQLLVKRGQTVKFHQKIGLVGSTGRSTGPHVHYELMVGRKFYDPKKFLLVHRNIIEDLSILQC
jgi:murein DD-endopeptidase MepM/ murein hydrolase activator NlpD